MQNVLRKAYFNHTPELSRVGAAKLLNVSRVTVLRWENFLIGAAPYSYPRDRQHREAMRDLLGVPLNIWEERLAELDQAKESTASYTPIGLEEAG